MNPHPRIRKTIKWGGAAATLLLVVVWIGSGWWNLHLGWSRYDTFVEGGLLSASVWPRELRSPECTMSRSPSSFGWGFSLINHRTARVMTYFVPLWFPAALVSAASGLAWRLDVLARRRARLNVCPNCHYDRAGLAAEANCPECGVGSG